MSVCPSVWFDSKCAGQILIKFRMDVMPWEPELLVHFQILQSNMANERVCDV
jgi:hypothetical protein